jgi:hypothetical protein
VGEAAPSRLDPKKELDWFDILQDTHADEIFSREFTRHTQLVDNRLAGVRLGLTKAMS